ncbi:hypothetical protein Taro_011074 [Colocasia esculenta]|uniref:Uncharacterized protein n=1 Tax=Colocasia esculenta TaxID=4460 RepID=A0A843U986_COLES|nr:hypothetical protein [Colocasia esculenta]
MTFTFVPLVGLFVPPLGDYKHFVYMGVNDGVFVPLSDVTRCGGYINVHDKVFVPPSDVYKLVGSSMLKAGLRQGVCASVGQRCLNARHLATAEDLNTNAESHVTTCGVFLRTWRNAARTLRTEHQRVPRTSPQHVRPI